MRVIVLVLLVVAVTCANARRGESSFGPSSHNHGSQSQGAGRRPSGGRPSGGWPSPASSTTTSSVSSSTTSAPISSSTSSSAAQDVEVETRTLDQIYAAALAEGGKLIIYAGGDTIDQQDYTKRQFEARFPGMEVEIIVDLSKFHDGRIDNQLATNTLIPDIAQLQTLHDFPRWKQQGVLLNYKANGWEHIYPDFKDEEGAYTGVFIIVFGLIVNTKLVPNQLLWPRLATALLRSDYEDKMIGTYPHDDDAVLFYYKQIIDKYGWDWMQDLVEQNVTWVRGTAASTTGVRSGDYKISIGTSANVVASNTSDVLLLLETDPFVSWAQRAAIFKNASHPEAAKLYMNWQVDAANQAGRFPIRDDVQSVTNRTIWQYSNTNPNDFVEFMEDRAAVEQFKTQINLYIGEVVGESPTGYPGLHPVEALPH